MMRGWRAVVAVLFVVVAFAVVRGASAEDCSRSCAADQRDERGCCPPPKVTPKPASKAPAPKAPAATPAPPPPAPSCSAGQEITVDTAGHCCWPGQVWVQGACIGVPTRCPYGYTPTADSCGLNACAEGMTRAQDGLHCCWPGQGWSVSRSVCVGTPSCPSWHTVSGESCTPMAVAKSGAAPAALSSPTLGKLVGIPPGSFLRDGAPGQRTVISQGYYLMESEVTQGMWRAVMGSQPSYFKDCGPTCPVEQVSWEDAVAFAERVSSKEGVRYRLPTEAEWEHAARGGQLGEYAGAADLGAVGWYEANSGGKPHPVCQKQRNGYGLCDMSGNVREWVSDWYGDYPAGSVTDPAGPSSGSDRVFRGSGWDSTPAVARVAIRGTADPSIRVGIFGFRLARSGP